MNTRSLLLGAATLLLTSSAASAKVWRINNNTGAAADFTDINPAYASALVVAGDTLHIEPSASQYSGNITKNTVLIGAGYLLDAAAGGNAGLQANPLQSRLGFFGVTAAGTGTRLIGMTLTSSYSSATGTATITFEKCRVESNLFFNLSSGTFTGITLRKCFLMNGLGSSGASFNNLIIENCIFSGDAGAFGGAINLLNASGTGCIFRNNVMRYNFAITLNNFYVANNIFINNGTTTNNTFTGSNVKNNLFNSAAASQTLPVGATNNQLGVTEANVFTLTGSSDARYMLKAGSPALAAGVTVGGVTTPDAGAYGGPDPYKLSGIPAIPTIYSITVPASIPQGQATMNVTFSTRSNN